MSTVSWLHISDLHRAQRGDRGRWPEFRDHFLDDLRKERKKRGVPDLILFTGDLAYSGDSSEYVLVQETLTEIKEALDADPWVVSVPGNHDLIRPKNGPHRVVLRAYAQRDEEVSRCIAEECAEMRRMLDVMFAGYTKWWKENIEPDWKKRGVHYSLGPVPGDFRASLELCGVRLGLVGLNSGYLHHDDDATEAKRSLRIEPEQAGADLSRWERRHDACLLLMHHPTSWLHPDCERAFENAVYIPDRFVVCVCGHMHAAGFREVASTPSKPRRFVQSPSLFGLEKYGTANETRACGYAWGRLKRTNERRGSMRRWTRRYSETRNQFGNDPDATDRREVRVGFRERSAFGTVDVVVNGTISEGMRADVIDALYTIAEVRWVTQSSAVTGTADMTVVITDSALPEMPTAASETVVLDVRQRTSTDATHAVPIRCRTIEEAMLAAKSILARLVGKAPARVGELALVASQEGSVHAIPHAIGEIDSEAKRLYEIGEFEDAADKFGQFLDALSAIDSTAVNPTEFRVERARATANVAACWLSLGRIDDARTQLEQLTDWSRYDVRLRVTLARFWVYCGNLELAERILPPDAANEDVRTVRQLIELHSGVMPTELHPDLKLDAVQLYLDQGQLAAAVDLALEVLHEVSG